MRLEKCASVSNGVRWICRRSLNGKRHSEKLTIRHGSWFSGSNLRVTEILEITYYWLRGERQVGAFLLMV
jgi:hypothetical protein